MDISISNIIWEKGKSNIVSFFEKLYISKIRNVELALNCIWEEPTKISNHDLYDLLILLKNYNLNVVSLHSLTYTRPDLMLFQGLN